MRVQAPYSRRKIRKIALMATPILLVLLKVLEPINIALLYIVKGVCFVFRIDLTPILHSPTF